MKWLDVLKKLLFIPPSEETRPLDFELPVVEKRELPPLSAYESRRQEIADSAESVEGVFYIYNGGLIPDYYSECLVSDRQNPRREDMYHLHFYPDYMARKFDGLYLGENSIPRGRAQRNMIFIDACYSRDVVIIGQIKELYRLPDDFTITTAPQYVCPACAGTVNSTYLSWPKLLESASGGGT